MLPSPVCPPARPLLPCLARTTILLTLPEHVRSGDQWTDRGGKKHDFTVLSGYRGRDVMPCDVTVVCQGADIKQLMNVSGANLDVAVDALAGIPMTQ